MRSSHMVAVAIYLIGAGCVPAKVVNCLDGTKWKSEAIVEIRGEAKETVGKIFKFKGDNVYIDDVLRFKYECAGERVTLSRIQGAVGPEKIEMRRNGELLERVGEGGMIEGPSLRKY